MRVASAAFQNRCKGICKDMEHSSDGYPAYILEQDVFDEAHASA